MDTTEAAGSQGDSSSPSVLVHVVSPSAEVPNRLAFPRTPLSTTIGEIKRKIQDAVPTKPSLERQRLIYRGHALGQSDMTLATLFGPEAKTNTDGFTLHLVLTMPGASINGALPLRDQPHLPRGNLPQPMGLPHLPGMRAAWPPRPASTSQIPLPGQDPTLHPQLPGQTPNQQPLPIPHMMQYGTMGPFPHIQQNIGQFPQIQGFANPQNFGVAYNTAQVPPQLNMPFPGLPAPWFPPQDLHQANNLPHGNPTNLQSNTHENPGQNTDNNIQSNSGEGTTTQTSNAPNNNPEHNNNTSAPSVPTTNNSSHGTNRQDGLQNGQAPVGQWRISINQTTYTGTPIQHTPMAPPPSNPNNSTQVPQTNFIPDFSRAELGNLAPRERLDRLQQLMNQMNNRSAGAGIGIDNGASAQRQSSSSPLAYLLSSPSGPQALILTSAGSFVTPGYNASIPHLPLVRTSVLQPQHHMIGRSLDTARNNQSPPAQMPGQAPPPNRPLPAQLNQLQQQQQQQQQQDQLGELLRILLPLGGHLWLFVRLCGFVYLFSSDRGWRNTFLLGICALLVFAAQTRVFEPLLEYIWNPIRRHIEAVIQVDQQQPGQGGAPQQGGTGAETPAAGSPEEMAQRLVQERRTRQNENPLRRLVARVERSIALFLASLVPGVGERHVAAREEVTRQEREREERARREEDERQRQAEESNQGVSEEEKQTTPANNSAEAATQGLDGIAEEASTDMAA